MAARAVLTLYLALVTLAGPWLCCCTAAQLARELAGDKQPTRPVPAASCCCCPEQSEAVPEPDVGAPPRPTPKNHCPCHDRRELATVGAAALAVTPSGIVTGEVTPAASPEPPTVLNATNLHADELPAGGYVMPCRARLASLHLLLC